MQSLLRIILLPRISKMYCEFDSVLRTPLDVATEYYVNACLFKQLYERATARNPANALCICINGAGVQSVANGTEQKDTAPQKSIGSCSSSGSTKPHNKDLSKTRSNSSCTKSTTNRKQFIATWFA